MSQEQKRRVMSNGHAKAALESKEGAERARADFANGVTVNPFDSHSGWRQSAWRNQTQVLRNRRDCTEAAHDRFKCCWEHDHHLTRWNVAHRGIKSCSFCEADAEVERERRSAADAEAKVMA